MECFKPSIISPLCSSHHYWNRHLCCIPKFDKESKKVLNKNYKNYANVNLEEILFKIKSYCFSNTLIVPHFVML